MAKFGSGSRSECFAVANTEPACSLLIGKETDDAVL